MPALNKIAAELSAIIADIAAGDAPDPTRLRLAAKRLNAQAEMLEQGLD